MSQIILHPETTELHAQVCRLRRELSELIRTRIRIAFEELPELRYRYSELFGGIERDIEQKTLEMSERKRLVELFALKLDRGQKIDKKTVELTMKMVYREFEQIRSRIFREAVEAGRKTEGKGFWIPDIVKRLDPDAGAKERRNELRRLYRNLAKRLHPDTRANDDPILNTWWELVRRSHERGDLHALRMLANLVGAGRNYPTGAHILDTSSTPEPLVKALEREQERLDELIETERERLEGIRSQEPFSLRERLDDEDWVAARREELRRELDSIEAETEKFDTFLAPILNGLADEVKPETVQNIWSNFVEDVYLN